MAISGTWAARSANAQAYTGALRWGTGVNPVHALRDNPGRVTGVKENLYPLGDASDAVADTLLLPDDFVEADWDGSGVYPGEDFRYQDDLPRWDQVTPQFREDIYDIAQGEWTSWGPAYPESDDFPLGGPTAGMDVALDVSHGEDQERQHAIAVPTRGVSGGWVNKARGQLATSDQAQDPGNAEYVGGLNTSMRQGQGVQSLVNDRALARGTDSPRQAIQSRTAGMVFRNYSQSFEMGGGAGTADMYPFQQTAGLKRPFVARAPGLPPQEEHYWNEMEGRVPLQRTVPPDPYQGDNESGGTTGGTDAIHDEGGDWGY